MNKIQEAVETYQKRKERLSHPDGSFDNQKRWYPSADEIQTCCKSIRTPSAAYPYSLLVHCRSIEHITTMFDIDKKILKRAVYEQSNRYKELQHKRILINETNETNETKKQVDKLHKWLKN